MRMLREVEGQHEQFGSRILDFDTAVSKCGLSNESNLRIDFTELHILMISYFELSDTTASAIRMEQSGTLRTEMGLATGLDNETED